MRLAIALLFVALAAAAQQQTGALAPARFDCAIDGTVVDRITHQPVPRAKLSLLWPRGNRSGAADNSGRWSFTDVACALVTIRATRFGYLDSGVIGSPPLNFLLSPDSPSHVSIELTPQSVITGKVVDENSDPIPGLRVVPCIARVVNGKRVLANGPQTVTNDIGEFRLAPLEAGSYIVCVEPGPGQMDYQPACYPAPIESGPAGAMRIPPGQETTMDFALDAGRAVRVSGSVANLPTGAHITVQLSRASGIGMGPNMATGTSPDGKFSFPQVAPGSYILGVAPVTVGENSLSARTPVEVGSSDVNDLALTLEPAISISGAIRVDSQNPPSTAPRVQISLRPSERTFGPITTAFSDDDRSFTITGVTPGTYSLTFNAGSWFLKSATLGGRDIAHGEFTIEAAPGPLQIVISDDGGSLEGDVALDDGSPAENAMVILLRDGDFVRLAPVVNGHFNVQNLQPGDYSASAWDGIRNVEYASPEWMRQHAGASVAATVQAGQNAQIKLIRQAAPPDY
jgi:hypothetical protein